MPWPVPPERWLEDSRDKDFEWLVQTLDALAQALKTRKSSRESVRLKKLRRLQAEEKKVLPPQSLGDAYRDSGCMKG